MIDEKRVADLMLADSLIGKQLWASRWLSGYGIASEWKLLNVPQTKGIIYVSILKDKTILLHFKDCAAPLSIYGLYLYPTKEEAESHIKACKVLGSGR